MMKRFGSVSRVVTVASFGNLAFCLIRDYRLFGPILFVGAASIILVLTNVVLAIGAGRRSENAIIERRRRGVGMVQVD